MTDTMTDTTSEALTSPIPSFSVRGVDFANMLANASLFTGKEKFRPVLTYIRLTVKGGELIAEATDSYTLYRERIIIDNNGSEAVIFLEIDEAKALAKTLGIDKSNFIRLTFGEKLTVEAFAISTTSIVGMTAPGYIGAQWPNVEAVRPADDFVGVDTSSIAFGSSILGRLGRLKLSEANKKAVTGEPVTMLLDNERKPSVWKIGKRIDITVMPVRMS